MSLRSDGRIVENKVSGFVIGAILCISSFVKEGRSLVLEAILALDLEEV